jgi:hypothetical protein
MKGFSAWLVLGEDAVPAHAVGTGGNVAGLDNNPPVRRHRKAEIYRDAVRLAQFKQGQKPPRPTRWGRILKQAKTPSPDINEQFNRPRTIGALLKSKQVCGVEGLCVRCRDGGRCLLSYLPTLGWMQ